jgi:hypothetical protein
MVQVEDQTGLATEKEIIATARKEKDMKVWNGYSETHVLIDRFDCQQTKSLADKSNFVYKKFLIDYKKITN